MNKRNKIDFTLTEEACIVEALKERKSLKEVASMMGCSVKPIKRIANKYNIKLNTACYALSLKEEQEVVELLKQYHSMPQIAKRFNCNPKSIASIAKRNNVKAQGNIFQLSEEDTQQVITRYANGEGFQKIAKEMKASGESIRKILILNNISIRPIKTPETKADSISRDYVHGGFNIKDITIKYSITDKVIYRLIKERNLIRLVEPIIETIQDRRRGRSVYQIWIDKYGKEEADKRQYAFRKGCSERSTGDKNRMYGKPSPQGSGNGWKGWYKGTFFRSLRELFFIVNVLEKENIQWINGEKKEYRMEYIDPTGRQRTYAPDYIVPSKVMYEIKPKRLWKTPLVIAKQTAAKAYCEARGMRYELIDPPIDGEKLKALFNNGDIKWTDKTKIKYLEYYK